MAGALSPWPARVHRADEAERRFGDLLSRLVPYLERGDDLADRAVAAIAAMPAPARQALVDRVLGANVEELEGMPSVEALGEVDLREALRDAPRGPVPEALLRLVRQAYEVPPWVDWERIERAGALFRRAGVLGGITLGLRSLVHGYAAPAGNKPLAFSGRLTQKADRRLAETGRFVTAVCSPGGLVPGALGWRLCLEVRLMHAQVRRLLLQSEGWRGDLWSLPINQHDMMATVLLFSAVFVDGVRQLGLSVSERAADDYQHLWRWVGHLLGVAPELLPATYAEAQRLGEFVYVTQGPPDDDSRALVRALLDGPRRRAARRDDAPEVSASSEQPSPRSHTTTPRPLPSRRALERKLAELHVSAATAVCRSLIGDELADALDLPKTGYRSVAPALRLLVRLLEGARLRSPRLEQSLEELGVRYWETSVRIGLGGLHAEYGLPERLDGRPAGKPGQ